jgi:nucleoside 2-deoxyribosyltransferase
MKTVYVAGPMSSDNILGVLGNVSEGIKLGAEVLRLGYAPFVPHLDCAFRLVQGSNYNVPVESYYEYTLEFLRRCDFVILCPNWENSKGTIAEIEEAERLEIPVVETLRELLVADGHGPFEANCLVAKHTVESWPE